MALDERPQVRSPAPRRPTVVIASLIGLLVVALLAVLIVHLAGGRGPDDSIGDTGPWHLVWSDEFTGHALNPADWAAENDSNFGDGGKQLACLMDRPANLSVGGGLLTLRARRESTPLSCGGGTDPRFPNGRSYSSAHISTKGLHDWTYGKFEMRARLPTQAGTSKGMWPAFWLRPTSGGTGELDVMEAVGSGPGEQESTKAYQTIWYDYTGSHAKKSNTFVFPGGGSPSDGMHLYSADWGPRRIRWYIDGKLVCERTARNTSWLTSTFDKPFYLRLNLAVGGTWPGDPTAATRFPASLQVDYVRVYQSS